MISKLNYTHKLKFSFPRKYCQLVKPTEVLVFRKEWNTNQAVDWVHSLSNEITEEDLNILSKQKIDAQALLDSSFEELWGLGITFGTAKKIMAALKKPEARGLDFLTVERVEVDKNTGLQVIYLKAPINPKDPSSNMLFIREFYPAYLASVRKYEYSIVIGNPGIGKSWFQFYYLVRILNIDKLGPLPDFFGSTDPPKYVVRQIGSDRMEIYDIQGRTVTKTTCSRDHIDLDNNITPKNTLYFYEPDLNKSNEPLSVAIPTVITVSPDTVRYKEFAKQKDAAMLYMPVWKEAELLSVRNFLPSCLTDEQVKNLFKEFGGIFRYVFGTKRQQLKARMKRDEAIATVDLKTLLARDTIEDTSVTHFIAQFTGIPPEDDEKGEAFSRFNIDFVNFEIVEKLREKASKLSIEDKITTLLKNDQCHTHASKICPILYEDVIEYRFTRDQGVNWEARINNQSKYDTFKLLLTSGIFSNVNEMEANTLYRPAADNFPLVDFIYKTNQTEFFGIQVSREEDGKRSITPKTMYQFLAQIPEGSKFTLLYVPSPKYADNASVSINLELIPFKIPDPTKKPPSTETPSTETPSTETPSIETPSKETKSKKKSEITITRVDFDKEYGKFVGFEIIKVPKNYQSLVKTSPNHSWE